MYLGELADLLAKHGHDVVSHHSVNCCCTEVFKVNYQPLHTNDYEETGVKVARTIIRPAEYDFGFNFTVFGGDCWKGVSIAKIFSVNLGEILENACRCELFVNPSIYL